jgi:hypothetical protein
MGEFDIDWHACDLNRHPHPPQDDCVNPRAPGPSEVEWLFERAATMEQRAKDVSERAVAYRAMAQRLHSEEAQA